MINLLLKLFVKDYKNTDDVKVRYRYGLLASVFGLLTNLLLFIAKITIGVILHLFSLISDSINNLSDFGNNVISIAGVKISSKPADEKHPYGHERMEYIISLIIGMIIISLGAIMLYQGAMDLSEFIKAVIETGKPLSSTLSHSFFVASISILSCAIFFKLLQSYLYFSLGKRINSMQLKALGKDARNDIISTSLVVISLVVTHFTGLEIDCFFTIAVAILVVISGVGILKEAVSTLLGEKPSKELIDGIVKLALNHTGVLNVHDLSIHSYGKKIYAVIHVEVDYKADIMLSHELCDLIESEAKEELNVDLTVHMDPIKVDDLETDMYREIVTETLKEESKMHLPIHDFRIVSGEKSVNVLFDIILPDELMLKRDEIEKKVKEKCEEKGKMVKLIVHYDSQASDLLKGRDCEYKDL